ncbi:MAG: hypothetical protein IPM21_05595 [Acidobacteria bacterium]|nr:hypothetical protein [Acidobacteriota bacterium]
MKKSVFIFAAIALASAAAFAQKAPNFAGTWTLDKERSELNERTRIETMKMTVAQTADSLEVATETKRSAPEGGGRGGMGGGRFGGGDGKFTYSLTERETTTEQATPRGPVPVTLSAKLEGATLKLTQKRTFSGQMGEITATSSEEWSLSADGKTLTVKRSLAGPMGTNTSTLVFTKQ